jgi:non-specific protein-tyrosine kinase
MRNNLDNSVRTDSQLADLLGAPNLGVIAFDRKAATHPLTAEEPPHSARAETFRQIRANLKFVAGARPPQVIAVTSALPGEGKTTTVCNLAIAMAETGQRVLVIEADLRRPKAADYLGLDRDVGLTSVLTGTTQFHDAVQLLHWSEGSFDVLTSGPLPANPTKLLSARQLPDLLAAARTTYDVVLIDTPPVLHTADVAELAPLTDGVVLVVRIGKTPRDQIQAAANMLAAVSSPVLGSVMSMAPRRVSATAAYRAPQPPGSGVGSPQSAHAGAGVGRAHTGPSYPANPSPSPIPRQLQGKETEVRRNDRPLAQPPSE